MQELQIGNVAAFVWIFIGPFLLPSWGNDGFEDDGGVTGLAPAAWTFSIWGLIYTLILIFVIY